MTVVSNDPSWWPILNSYRFYSNFVVAACVAVIYDWALALGQEVELIWRQHWTLMSILYLVVRYAGIPYAIMHMLVSLPTVSLTDAGCNATNTAINWTDIALPAVLGVIMIARLYAMYQGARKMLIFLVVSFLAVNSACVVLAAVASNYFSGEELILSGNHTCIVSYNGNVRLIVMIWMLNTVWEVLALFLSVWIAVKHFRDLRRLRRSGGSTIEDCFKVLMKSHVLYFASFVAAACFQFGSFSPNILGSDSVGAYIYRGVDQVFLVVQMFVLGPRLILGIREYHAKLVADSDAATAMTSIAFQERVHISTSNSV